MYEIYKLDNNTQIIFVPVEGTKSVTTLVMYPVGSRYETEKMSGVSHYVEHLMFKGTKKRPNTLKLTREIDRLGAHYNAFTSKEYTGYYITTDVSYSETAIDILSDMLFDSVYDKKEMEREKGVIVEEIRMYKDNPLMNIDNIFEDLMYEGCPLGRDIAGTEKHVLGYNRKDVLDYRDKYYEPQNMIITVSGAVDEKTKKLIKKYFGSRKNKRSSSKSFKPHCFGSGKKEDRLLIEHKETDQAQLMIGFPGFKYNDKRNVVEGVMNTILGGSMSSRLFIQIRERRGLAYMIRSGSDNFRDTGYAYVRAGLDAKNINKAIEVIKKEIEKIVKKGVTKKELEDAKTHIRGSLTLSLEDSGAQASWYARQVMFVPKIKTPEQRLAEIDNVTNEDIKRVAKQIFKWDKMRVAVIGNVKKEDVKF
ncbi:insulinase family protein [Candidatus Parcubacteria bacterium]|jgi:predicted Zn-dependent peptidase|nr:insulinase family protein [Candidatus Parcubacteria bacterium]MBT3948676.1 insulinase family protein [Candidatus Parcubacteria bacterium]